MAEEAGTETFGEVVLRLLPHRRGLAQLAKEARLGYDWLHVNVHEGKRATKGYISILTGEAILDALERMGAYVTARDREAMMMACVNFGRVSRPYRITLDRDGVDGLGTDALRVAEAYEASPEAIKRAFDSLALTALPQATREAAENDDAEDRA